MTDELSEANRTLVERENVKLHGLYAWRELDRLLDAAREEGRKVRVVQVPHRPYEFSADDIAELAARAEGRTQPPATERLRQHQQTALGDTLPDATFDQLTRVVMKAARDMDDGDAETIAEHAVVQLLWTVSETLKLPSAAPGQVDREAAIAVLRKHLPMLESAALPTKCEVFVVCGSTAREMHDAILALAAPPLQLQAQEGHPNPALRQPPGAQVDPASSAPTTAPEAVEALKEPPWPASSLNNCKRAGWLAFSSGQSRDACPFPPARTDLTRGFQAGWDTAFEHAAAAALAQPTGSADKC